SSLQLRVSIASPCSRALFAEATHWIPIVETLWRSAHKCAIRNTLAASNAFQQHSPVTSFLLASHSPLSLRTSAHAPLTNHSKISQPRFYPFRIFQIRRLQTPQFHRSLPL